MASKRVPRAPNGDRASGPAPTPAPVSARPAIASPDKPRVTVTGYVRPPARESPAIVRANQGEEGEGAAASSVEFARPPVEPLFSNEGLLLSRPAGVG
jgi:hypothetical protein